MRQTVSFAVFAVALAAAPWNQAFGQAGAIAPEKDPHAGHHAEDPKRADATYAEGEVRKVDKEAGKITLKHGPIQSLDMPAMSMVFRAQDPAMLDAVKVGDKVRFKADKIQGSYTITEMQPAK